MRGLIFTILILLCTCFVQAQTSIVPEQLTIEDGLSQGYIYCLHQDKEGFLWIGTKNGLNRYDGHSFKVFSTNRNDPYSLSNDEIQDIIALGDYLVLRTGDAKLELFHKPTERFYQIKLPILEKPEPLGVTNVFKDQSHNFWINTGSPQQLIKIRFPDEFWEKAEVDTQLLSKIEGSIIFENGELISTLNDTTLLVETNGQRALFHTQSSTTSPLSSNHPFFNAYDHKNFGALDIVIANNQLSIIQADTIRKLETQTPNIYFYFDQDTRYLWLQNPFNHEIFTFPIDILFKLKRSTIKEEEAVFTSAELKAGMTAWLKDHSGNIWLGTGGYGLFKISPRLTKVKHFAVGQSIPLEPVAHSSNEILLKKSVVQNDYVYIADGKRALANINQFLRNNQEDGFFLEQDRNSNYWMLLRKPKKPSHEAILYQFLKDGSINEKWRSDNHANMQMAYNTKKESLLIVVDDQFVIYDITSGQKQSITIQFPDILASGITSIVQAQNEDIWITTTRGLIQLKTNGKEFFWDTQSSGLLHNNCSSLLLDPADENLLWVATKGGGLHQLDTRNMEFQYINTSNGLPNDVIYGILNDDKGNLWMSSNKGIIRYHPIEGTIRNFLVEDGMQSNEFNTHAYFKAPDGSLLFGGVNGLNVFDPNDLVDNPHTPMVSITKLEVNNQVIAPLDSTQILTKAIEFSKEVHLPYSQNNITLEFAALEFTAPSKNKFRYYIDGLDSKWQNESTDHRATYLNLPPGQHLFRIKGANGDGIWSEQVTELWIHIQPPWYRTSWAYLGYCLLILGGIAFAFFLLRYRLQLQHKIDLEQKEAERLRELDEFRSKLYTNITHEFRTPLTVMLGTNQQLSASENNAKRRRKLGLIQRNGLNLLQLINQLLDLSKIEHQELKVNYVQGDLLKYVRYLTESFYALANTHNVLLQVDSKEGEIIMDYDPIKIQQILSNLIANAIKYTPSGGKVSIALSIEANHILEIVVQDTGQGIPAGDLPHIFKRYYQVDNDQAKAGGTGIGLALTQELVKLLQGSISVESLLGKGSKFLIQLPIRQEAELLTKGQAKVPILATPLPYYQKEQTPLNGKDNRILIIEDNPDVVEYLSACLEEHYQLNFAYNGQAGIETALELIPDLIIADVMMPKKTGFEVTATLKEDEKTSHIPIILLTAKADIASKLAGLKWGADLYLAKPFFEEELLIQIQNLLEIRQKLQAHYQSLASGPPSPDQSIQQEDKFLYKIRQVVEENLREEDFDIPALCKAVGMSRSQLHHKLKALTNLSTSHYVRSVRLHKAKALLEKGQMSVSEVSYAVGYKSRSYFSRAFLEEFGQSPSDFLGK